jgi:uncharacterized protein YfdQ (DUF2303 family)
MADFDVHLIDAPSIRTEADAVHQQTLLGVEPVLLDPGKLYAIRTCDGFKTIDLTTESVLQAAGELRSRPRSNYAFHKIESFVAYVKNVSTKEPDRRGEVLCIADESIKTIRVIFDALDYQWGDVYTDLKLQASPEWQRWCSNSGRYMSQQDFAEFCELNLESFATPSAATILEIAQTFQAKKTVDFASAVRLSSGAIKLKHEEKIEASAGERADITIPEELRLALPIFKYDKPYEVRARLRYRIVEGSVRLSVLLIDPEMALEHTFQAVVDQVAEQLEMPVFYGKV